MALILASTSAIRRQMLAQAGVQFEAVRPQLDEEAEKKAFSGDAAGLPLALAEAKALSLSAREACDWVIGSDSIVQVDDRQFDKPASRDEAADHLRFFSGKTMVLTSAVALANGGRIDWSFSDSARLHVRNLSETYIDSYLDEEWPEVGYCVGVFRMEGPGVQLFEAIEGSYFTILGMPLLPLLEALRARGLAPQ